jgi:hypothetical protein
LNQGERTGGAESFAAHWGRFVSELRFTVVDETSTVSFVGPGHLLKMLAAACSRFPKDHRDLIEKAADYDANLAKSLLAGLTEAEFSVRNTRPARLGGANGEHDLARPFHVSNDETRRLSMEPAADGLVVFNLVAKRIVQIRNSYGELQRRDRGRLRRDGRPVRAFYSYELPADWRIVP